MHLASAVCDGARSRQEKIQLRSRKGVVGKKKVKEFPCRVLPARKNLIFWPKNFSQGTKPTRLHTPNAVAAIVCISKQVLSVRWNAQSKSLTAWWHWTHLDHLIMYITQGRCSLFVRVSFKGPSLYCCGFQSRPETCHLSDHATA